MTIEPETTLQTTLTKWRRAAHQSNLFAKPDALIIGIITLLALFLRLWRLGNTPLFVDEVMTYLVALKSPSELLIHLRRDLLNAPLDVFILSLFAVQPIDEFVFRLPIAIMGTLGVPLSFALMRKVWNREIAIITALFLTLTPFHIRYSQEARNYASFAAVHLLSLILLVRAVRLKTLKAWIPYAFAGALMFYTHIYASFVLAAQFLFLALYRLIESSTWPAFRSIRERFAAHRKELMYHAISIVLAFLPYMLFLIYRLSNPAESAIRDKEVTNFVLNTSRASAFPVNIPYYWRMLQVFITNSYDTGVLLFLLTALALLAISVVPRRKRALCGIMWLYLLLNALAVGVVHWWSGTGIGYRRELYLVPVFLSLSAIGMYYATDAIARVWKTRGGTLVLNRVLTVCVILVVLLWIPSIHAYYQSEKQDFKSAVRILTELAGPHDIVIDYTAMGASSGMLPYLDASQGDLFLLYPDEFFELAEGVAQTDHASDLKEQKQRLENAKAKGATHIEAIAHSTVPVTVWSIFPFPIIDGGVNLNEIDRLQTIQTEPSRRPYYLMTSLSATTIQNPDYEQIRQVIVDGLVRTAVTTFPINSTPRTVASRTLASIMAEEDLALALKEYREAEDTRDLEISRILSSDIVSNGDFRGGTLDGWTLIDRSGSTELTIEPGGAYATIADEATNTTQVYRGAMCQTLEVQGGAHYAYRFAASTNLEAGSKATLGYWDYMYMGQQHSESAFAAWSTTPWTTYSAVIQVPFYVRSITLCPALLYGTGAISVDKIELFKVRE